MPGEEADYSENDLITKHGWDYGPCAGGTIDMSVAYLSRWQGPINESDNPYSYSYSLSDEEVVESSTVRKHVQNVIYLPIRETPLDASDQDIKQAVMTYGAVYVTMNWCGGAYNSSNHSYYDDGSYSVDGGHAVDIVGWDDNYSASNFHKTAPGTGAFIVRNSWGTGWGESGYFYVSYYAQTFGQQGFSAVMIPEPPSNYMSVYQYDPLGWVDSWGYMSSTAWAANIFSAVDNKPLDAVSFYAVDAGLSYEIYIYTGVAAGKPRSGTLRSSLSGSETYAGYYTVDLPSEVPLAAGQKFSVVMKFMVPNSSYPVPTEDRTGDTTKATASAGQSFMDPSGTIGTSWEDLYTQGYYSNICIKAFTAPSPTIAVTAPVAGTNWYRGSNLPIIWTKSGTQSANVKIQLYKGSTMVKAITLTPPNDGSFDWLIPAGPVPAANYRVRITTVDNKLSAYSGYFTVSKPTITITAPTTGTVWTRGTTQTINWVTTGVQNANVKIQLFRGTTKVLDIALTAPNSGDYSWTIPASLAAGTNYKVKVKTADGTLTAASPAFTLN